jgi:hypothetical protein
MQSEQRRMVSNGDGGESTSQRHTQLLHLE